ncbi:DDE_3 domain-containing protein [Trichonephila clavipes]|nr:DDE_3 domain-containing protein [Trichonephila clavipes]
MHVKRRHVKTYDRDYVLPTVKHGEVSVSILAALPWSSALPIVILNGRFAGEKYKEILADQVHSMMQILFPAGGGIFNSDNAAILAVGLFKSWLVEHTLN